MLILSAFRVRLFVPNRGRPVGILRDLFQAARYVAADDKDKAATELAQEELVYQEYLTRKDAAVERVIKSIAAPFVD